ncbi:MAG: homoserine kinase [Candidatus Acidiferrales bacterium]
MVKAVRRLRKNLSPKTARRQRTFEVCVPASTANLGAGFDCFGLALELHLKVRATLLSGPATSSRVRSRGAQGSALITRVPDQNLIFRAMHLAAEREGFDLPPVRMAVHNAIPVGSGLGSSAAAIIAGISIAFSVGGRPVSTDAALRYATEMEGHADNVGAALLGGLVVTAVRSDGSVAAIRRRWPKEVRIVVVTPEVALETAKSRTVLPKIVQFGDAVHNLQRAALLIAALEERRFDLLWDALQDRLHQAAREHLIPGLPDILRMPRKPGFLGVALSGAGPSVVALAIHHLDEIGKSIANKFEGKGLRTTIRRLEISEEGQTTTEISSPN